MPGMQGLMPHQKAAMEEAKAQLKDYPDRMGKTESPQRVGHIMAGGSRSATQLAMASVLLEAPKRKADEVYINFDRELADWYAEVDGQRMTLEEARKVNPDVVFHANLDDIRLAEIIPSNVRIDIESHGLPGAVRLDELRHSMHRPVLDRGVERLEVLRT